MTTTDTERLPLFSRRDRIMIAVTVVEGAALIALYGAIATSFWWG